MARRTSFVAVVGFAFILGCGDVPTPTATRIDGGAAMAARAANGPTITDIETRTGPTDSSVAAAINDKGFIVGYIGVPTGIHASLWKPRSPVVDLGLPPGDLFSAATAINRSGTIVGLGYNGLGADALRWTRRGSMRVLPTLPGATFTSAAGINGAGVIVGNSGAFAVRWDASGVTSLGTLPGGTFSRAGAINTNGDVVGSSDLHPVRWSSGGAISALSTPPGSGYGEALAINDAGGIAGYVTFTYPSAVYWNAAGTPIVLAGLPGGYQSTATAIDKLGDVAGWATNASGQTHAVLWPHGSSVALDLGTLPGRGSSLAYGMNGNGDIVGYSGGYPDPSVRHAACWSSHKGC